MPFVPPTTYATKGNTGYEAVFSIGTVSSPFSLNPVLEVKSIQNNGVDVPQVPLTHLLSPNATEEFSPGLIKPGTIEVGGNFIGSADQLSFLQLAEAEDIFTWQITASMQQGAKTYTCSGKGYVAKYMSGPFENNKPIEFKVSIQITGTITEAVA